MYLRAGEGRGQDTPNRLACDQVRGTGIRAVAPICCLYIQERPTSGVLYGSELLDPCQPGMETMHAALVNLTIDPEQAPAAASVFTNDILPTVRGAPRFVAGYWLDPADDGVGFAFVLFETEEEARQSVPPASKWDAPGVAINSVTLRRVAVTLP
jgi:hypothetical protein